MTVKVWSSQRALSEIFIERRDGLHTRRLTTGSVERGFHWKTRTWQPSHCRWTAVLMTLLLASTYMDLTLTSSSPMSITNGDSPWFGISPITSSPSPKLREDNLCSHRFTLTVLNLKKYKCLHVAFDLDINNHRHHHQLGQFWNKRRTIYLIRWSAWC